MEEIPWHSGPFCLLVFKQLCQSSTKTKPKGGACLWRMEWCFLSVRVETFLCMSLKTATDLNLPSPCFTVTLKHCGIILSPVHLLPYAHLFLTLIYYLDSSVNKTLLSHPLWNSGISLPTSSDGLVSLLRSGLETAPHPLRCYRTAFWQEDFCWLVSNTFIHWPQTAFQIGGAHQQRKWQLIQGWCRITSTTCAHLVIELLPQDLQ